MKKIYIFRSQLNRMNKESLYLVFQCTRVINSIKTFNKLLKEKEHGRNKNDLNGKEFIEILLFNASSIWEVLDLLNKDLAKRMKGTISDELQKRVDKIILLIKSGKDESINILKDIRNKHSFHIAYDKNYALSFFKDGPSRWDMKIGMLASTREEDIVYTIEDEILMSYLMREFNKTENEVFDLIIESISKYVQELLNLFNSILFELVDSKIYIC